MIVTFSQKKEENMKIGLFFVKPDLDLGGFVNGNWLP
jgi:hypothetical protein